MGKAFSFFDIYDKLGWQIVPILPNSKRPFMKGWNQRKEDVRGCLTKYPECNLGLCLGKIIDIEADSLEANYLLNRLIIDSQHPIYQSEKSTHHLFLTHDYKLTRTTIKGIEFRGYRHQSLLPPSINANGVEYIWLTDPYLPIAPLPKSLTELYRQPKPVKFVESLCARCGHSRAIHHKRYMLEVAAFNSIGMKWHCHKCRTVDIRHICRKMPVNNGH